MTVTLFGGGSSISDRIADLAPGAAVWPLDETTGTTAYDVMRGLHLTHSGTTLAATSNPFGGVAAQWDGVTDLVSAVGGQLTAIAALWNGEKYSIGGWAKVQAGSVWSDGAFRKAFTARADANNRGHYYKTSTANQTLGVHVSGATNKTLTSTGLAGTTAWWFWLMTVDRAGNSQLMYEKPVGGSTTTTGPNVSLGAWSGALANFEIGADTVAGSQYWNGYFSHVFWTPGVALTAGQAAALAALGG